ncbi:hypothetical protein ACFFU8_08955 [Chromobacterium piscinae]|uniref:hypothetical protein n=1 Tax=Chromobacterium piscinae TaxID=686831 RepID=UPI001E395A76|nr:hypothetical protein [Chromobacterium piscinae]MCD5327968.1 hypothetical protein [Chromobacterium piscinae]
MSDVGEMKKALKRLGLVDKQAIESSLEIAALALLPDEYSQRDIFRALMPKLHLMRKRGFSFRQIATLLEQAGLKLAIGTVRTYYYEFLMEMLEECESYTEKSSKVVSSVSAGDASKRGGAPAVDESKAVHSALRSQVDDAAKQRTASTVSRFVGTAAGASMAPPAAGPQPALPQAAAGEAPASAGTILTQPKKPTPPPAGARPGPLDADPGGAAPPPTSRVHPTPAQPGPAPALDAHGRAAASARCITEPTPDQIEERGGLPAEVYDAGQQLEHPAIPGLLLDRNQRFFKARLEYVKADGSNAFESGKEMLARRDWRKPIQASQGRTSKDFVPMDTSVLGRPKSNN